MFIESYSFGRMVIEGEEYRDDLMIYNREVNSGWVRRQGHQLSPDDITWITNKDPDLIVIGTGSTGRMKVKDKTRKLLKKQGIEFWIGKTEEAADHFNSKLQAGQKKIAGAFHLTC